MSYLLKGKRDPIGAAPGRWCYVNSLR